MSHDSSAKEAVAAAIARSPMSPAAMKLQSQVQGFADPIHAKIEAIKKALNEAQYRAGVAVFGQDPPTNALPGDRIIGPE